MNKIKSLNLLIDTINKVYTKNDNVSSLKTILNNYSGEDWKDYISLGSGYIKKKLYYNELYEIYAITWNPNSCSPIHDHASNGCIFNVLEGNLKEELYDTEFIKLYKVNYYNTSNNIAINNNDYYHKISNISNQFAYSLNINTPIEYKMNTFSV